MSIYVSFFCPFWKQFIYTFTCVMCRKEFDCFLTTPCWYCCWKYQLTVWNVLLILFRNVLAMLSKVFFYIFRNSWIPTKQSPAFMYRKFGVLNSTFFLIPDIAYLFHLGVSCFKLKTFACCFIEDFSNFAHGCFYKSEVIYCTGKKADLWHELQKKSQVLK